MDKTEELTKAAEAINTLALLFQADSEEIIELLTGTVVDEEEAGQLKLICEGE